MTANDDELFRRFRVITTEHLLPMLPGAALEDEDGEDSRRPSQLTSQMTGLLKFKLRPDVRGRRHLVVKRSQMFSRREFAVATAFAEEFDHVNTSGVSSLQYRDVLVGTISERVAVRIAAESAGLVGTGLDVLARQMDVLRSWSSQTYEGQPIAASLGVDAGLTGAGPALTAYARLPSAKVLGDGVATLQIFDAAARLLKFENLSEPPVPIGDATLGPHSFRRLAAWTASHHRGAACLTRRGEILIFTGGSLQFARRRGLWLHANHEGARATWTNVRTELRAAIYATCLDASFSRTGACIAVVREAVRARVLRTDVKRQDQIGHRDAKEKGAMLRCVVGGRRFQDLPREIRQQLVAMDGAVVLAADGAVLAAGAIVMVEGGSDGGGRLAATRSLASHGFAVKVSADGEIRAYQGSSAEPTYVGL